MKRYNALEPMLNMSQVSLRNLLIGNYHVWKYDPWDKYPVRGGKINVTYFARGGFVHKCASNTGGRTWRYNKGVRYFFHPAFIGRWKETFCPAGHRGRSPPI